jgi:Ca-activated chloride channel family protein
VSFDWLPSLDRPSFDWPLALLALFVVPLGIALYLWAQRRRGKYAVRFTNLDLLANVVQKRPNWKRHVPPALFLAAVAALAVSLARPHMNIRVPKEEATVVLVMDISGSMNATDVEPTRLEAAQTAAGSFLDDVPEKFRIGIVSFSASATLNLPPTTDRMLAHEVVDRLRANGGTAMGDALVLALDATVDLESIDTLAPTTTGSQPPAGETAAKGTRPPTAILLLSDGANTLGRTQPFDAAAQAKELGIPIFTVALGTPDGTVEVPGQRGGGSRLVRVPPDEETLKAISEETGGEFYAALSNEQLQNVYKKLSSKIGYDTRQREVSWAFGAAAGVLMLAGAGLSLAWFNRFP